MLSNNKAKHRLLTAMIVLSLSALISACNMGEVFRSFGGELERVCAQDELVVDRTEDANDAVCNDVSCTLREAVVTANTCNSDQTIVVPAGTYELSRHGLNEDIARSGDLDVTAPVTIRAEGSVLVDGDDTVRIFDIRLEEDGEVRLEGLRLQNAVAGEDGAAIRMVNGDLTLDEVVVSSSVAGSPEANASGGGIYVGSGHLTLIGSEVSGNATMGEGGGIFVSALGELTMDEASSVVSNRSLDNYGGGGIFNKGTAAIAGIINENSSTWTGGGIHNNGQMDINGAEIRNNVADSAGGGIATTDRLRIANTSFSDNEAPDGGGLFSYTNRYTDSDRTLVYLVDTGLHGNEADNAGGGVFISDDGLLVGTRINVGRNHADRGGGLFTMGEVVLIESNILANQIDSPEGGGVFNGGRLSIRRSTLSENLAPGSGGAVLGGAAIWNDRGGTVDLINSTVSENEIFSGQGAAIFNLDGAISAKHITVADNGAAGFSGPSGMLPAVQISSSIVLRNSGEDCTAQLSSNGFNFFEDTSCGVHADDVLFAVVGGSEGLDSLASNGGVTQTHALLEGSPALDAAGESCLESDQRGEPRPAGEACDIGAFEGSIESETRSAAIDINFNADRYTIEEGQCTTLRWQVTGAERIVLLGQEREATEAQQVCPNETRGYTLLAESAQDEAESYLQIEVTEPDVSQPGRPPCIWLVDPDNANNSQTTCYASCPVPNEQAFGDCTP